MRTVLFVCTGNTCRSPMAEAIARDLVRRGEIDGLRPDDVFFASAGVSAADGMAISAETLDALERRGIAHEGSSKRLTAEMVRRADLVLAMTGAHLMAIRQIMAEHAAADPAALERVRLVDDERDVEDPIGLGQPAYDRVAERLEVVIPLRLREVAEVRA